MNVAYRFGDVLLATLTFSDGSGAKKRPVLVVHEPGDDDLLVVPVTSHPTRVTEDVTINDWAAAGLRLPSTARMAKLTTLGKVTVVRAMGKLSAGDTRTAREVLSRFFDSVLR
ncbi:MAG: type II toxin-antitoxin system PemK/MazF family toxin [Verrucomicrobia bacterium]|nr:type II toxin-antitoxin system PemK/MazF family toxin [Verrucomicrobiota bacterium]